MFVVAAVSVMSPLTKATAAETGKAVAVMPRPMMTRTVRAVSVMTSSG